MNSRKISLRQLTSGPVLDCDSPLKKASKNRIKEIFRAEVQNEKRRNPGKQYIGDPVKRGRDDA